MKNPQFKSAFSSLSWWERSGITHNIPALLFSFIYFFFCGMWRKGLTILAAFVIYIGILASIESLIGITLPNHSERPLAFLFSALFCAHNANRAYYLHKVKGSKSWNPFEHDNH